jgi:putative tryptophan/tyrosine transport system substrate-binding protein
MPTDGVAAYLPAARAAKAAAGAIPIVFISGTDPVESGLVASFNQPGGNVTGVSVFTNLLVAKRLELLREVVQGAMIAVLVNPRNQNAAAQLRDVEAASSTLGQKIHVLSVSTENEIREAFATLVQRRIGALLVGADTLFTSRADQIASLATRNANPTIHNQRDSAAVGGLMSYGPSSYRLAGTYVGRILKGEKPADLPVQQSTKVELVVNLKTARILGLTIPLSLLGLADEVIEMNRRAFVAGLGNGSRTRLAVCCA